MYISNYDYEILTHNGFQSFDGIKISNNQILEVEFDDGTTLKCSPGHTIISDDFTEIEAQFLKTGDTVISETRKTVKSILNLDENGGLFDLINVNGHLYYTNGVLSHNCDTDFTTSGHTIIEAEILKWYKENHVREPLERRGISGDYWLWAYPDYSKSYVITADVSRGDGSDYSAFSVYDLDANEQVAEYKAKIATTEYGRLLVQVGLEWNNALLVIENSNIGWSTVQTVLDLNYNNVYYTFKDDPYVDMNIHLKRAYDLVDKENMIPGFGTNTRTRPTMISKIEIYTREKTFIYHSSRKHHEFETFKWKDGKAQAESGFNDDLVMETGIYLFVRDTALRMKQYGINLQRVALKKTFKSVQKSKTTYKNPYEMQVKNKKVSLQWLLK